MHHNAGNEAISLKFSIGLKWAPDPRPKSARFTHTHGAVTLKFSWVPHIFKAMGATEPHFLKP